MPAPSPTQAFYAGEFRHLIDDKNRITIPARWRRGQSEEFILLPEAAHQFLLVMSPEEFARMSPAAESDTGVSARDRLRFWRYYLRMNNRDRWLRPLVLFKNWTYQRHRNRKQRRMAG